jgi:predicted Rossmann fold flavoprotein
MRVSSAFGSRPTCSSTLILPSRIQSGRCDFKLAQSQPRTSLRNTLSTLLPGKVADAVLDRLKIRGDTTMANFPKEQRRSLVQALLEWPLPVTGGRGYNFAEVTAGGVPLAEVDPSTLGSRCCPGLYFTGEILDVDGRLGGFNFQWAWSSAWVVASALVRS